MLIHHWYHSCSENSLCTVIIWVLNCNNGFKLTTSINPYTADPHCHIQGLSQDLENGYPKLTIVNILGIQSFNGEHNQFWYKTNSPSVSYQGKKSSINVLCGAIIHLASRSTNFHKLGKNIGNKKSPHAWTMTIPCEHIAGFHSLWICFTESNRSSMSVIISLIIKLIDSSYQWQPY